MRLLWGLGAFLVLAAALVGSAYAGCATCTNTGGGGTWMGAASMGLSWDGETSSMAKTSETEAAGSNTASSAITARELFEDQTGDQRLVMAYVGVPGDASYIEGSIHLPLDKVFREDNSLKSPAEIAALFGAAGITESDPLVIYGDFFVNGYDTFAFWVMKYLGHEDVVLLEGTKGGREAAGLKFVANPSPKAAETYTPSPNLDVFATADQLASSQVVDARGSDDYDVWHPDGAVNIDCLNVMGTNGLASAQALDLAFRDLDLDLPVVVYSSKGGQASIVWYALYAQGYQASLYILTSMS